MDKVIGTVFNAVAATLWRSTAQPEVPLTPGYAGESPGEDTDHEGVEHLGGGCCRIISGRDSVAARGKIATGRPERTADAPGAVPDCGHARQRQAVSSSAAAMSSSTANTGGDELLKPWLAYTCLNFPHACGKWQCRHAMA